MAEYLGVERGRVHVIPHGLKLEGHKKPPEKPGAWERSGKSNDKPRVIGYLARICEDKGLHLLIEACEKLASRGDVPPFVVRAAGYLGDGDRAYLEKVNSLAANGALKGRFEYVGELDRAGKIAFLQSLDVFSTPTVYRESKGLPALEAMANGVPMVLPDHGSFPEMVADTGGGVLHRRHDVGDLAEKLGELLRDPERARQLGLAGQRAVHERYHAETMARQTLELYRRLTAGS
jgi:glycosyltransferase involved in cell wall biosynthesis